MKTKAHCNGSCSGTLVSVNTHTHNSFRSLHSISRYRASSLIFFINKPLWLSFNLVLISIEPAFFSDILEFLQGVLAHLRRMPAHSRRMLAHWRRMPAHSVRMLAHWRRMPAQWCRMPAHWCRMPAQLCRMLAQFRGKPAQSTIKTSLWCRILPDRTIVIAKSRVRSVSFLIITVVSNIYQIWLSQFNKLIKPI